MRYAAISDFGGVLENLVQVPNRAITRTMRPYDRRRDERNLHEVEKIRA